MRAVVQRVRNARVEVDGQVMGRIDQGLLVYLGVGGADTESDAEYLCEKITGLRIFEDESGKMNLAVLDIGGSLLVISQFTLYGDCRKGKRPSFSSAASPERAIYLYDYFIKKSQERGLHVETGVFQAMMKVQSINQGPVTILLDSQKQF